MKKALFVVILLALSDSMIAQKAVEVSTSQLAKSQQLMVAQSVSRVNQTRGQSMMKKEADLRRQLFVAENKLKELNQAEKLDMKKVNVLQNQITFYQKELTKTGSFKTELKTIIFPK